MRFAEDRPIRLGRRGTISMAVRQWYVVAVESGATGLWKARTTGYDFRLLDREDRDIVAYHWHPSGPSRVTRPHLHIGGRTSPTDLSKVHLTTGRVSLADVVGMAITEMGVEPLRPDWQEVRERAERDLAEA